MANKPDTGPASREGQALNWDLEVNDQVSGPMTRIKDAMSAFMRKMGEVIRSFRKDQTQLNKMIQEGAEQTGRFAKAQAALSGVAGKLSGVLGTLKGGFDDLTSGMTGFGIGLRTLSLVGGAAAYRHARGVLDGIAQAFHSIAQAGASTDKMWKTATGVAAKFTHAWGASREESVEATTAMLRLGNALNKTEKEMGPFLMEYTKLTLQMSKSTGMAVGTSADLVDTLTRFYRLGPGGVRAFGDAFKYLTDKTGTSSEELAGFLKDGEKLFQLLGLTGKKAELAAKDYAMLGAVLKQNGVDSQELTQIFADIAEGGPEAFEKAHKFAFLIGRDVNDVIKSVEQGNFTGLINNLAKQMQGQLRGYEKSSGSIEAGAQEFKLHMSELAKMTGLSSNNLLHLARSADKLDFSGMTKSMEKETKKQGAVMNKTLKHIHGTYEDHLEGMQIRMAKVVAKATKGLADEAEKLTNKAIDGLDSLIKKYEQLDHPIKTWIKDHQELLLLAFALLGPTAILRTGWGLVAGAAKGAWNMIKGIFGKGGQLAAGVEGALGGGAAAQAGKASGFLKGFKALGSKAGPLAALFNAPTALKAIYEDFTSKGMWGGLVRLPAQMSQWAANAVNSLTFGFAGYLTEKLGGDAFKFSEIGKRINAMFELTWDDVKLLFDFSMREIVDDFKSKFKTLDTVVDYFMKSSWMDRLTTMKDASKLAWETIKTNIVNQLHSIKKTFFEIWDDAKKKFGGAIDWLKDKFHRFKVWLVGNSPGGEIDKIRDGLIEPLQLIKDAWLNTWNFIKDMVGGLLDKITGFWDKVKASAKQVLGAGPTVVTNSISAASPTVSSGASDAVTPREPAKLTVRSKPGDPITVLAEFNDDAIVRQLIASNRHLASVVSGLDALNRNTSSRGGQSTQTNPNRARPTNARNFLHETVGG